MLAIGSYQVRIFDNSDPEGANYDTYVNSMNEDESFRFCLGMTAGELENNTATTSKYGRWIYRMDIIVSGSSSSGGSGGGGSSSDISVTGLALDKTTASLKTGSKLQLSATVVPEDATNNKITWSSSDNSLATVDANGLVTGIATGSVKITATSQSNSKVSAVCTITVTQNTTKVAAIALDKSAATIVSGSQKQLTALIFPSDAADKEVAWTSGNDSVATVDASGLVTAKSAGKATITATSKDGGKTATCVITVVSEAIPVTGVSLNRSTATLALNNTLQLKATISPADATNANVSWGSDNPAIATVDTNGLVTAKGIGTTKIMAVTEDGSKTAYCTINVEEAVSGSAFTDIADSWAKDNIEKMVSLGVIGGYDDGSFKPNATITRAEFVTILVKALVQCGKLSGTSSDSGFPDTYFHWASSYISTAIDNDIVGGVSKNAFSPNNNITREEMAVIIARAFALTDSDSSQSTAFADSSSIDSWADQYITATCASGIMTGRSGNLFGPKENSTRAEAVTVILRALISKGYIKTTN